LDQHRLVGPGVVKIFGGEGDETCGVFAVPSPIDGARMHVIASSELGWDHVSVSRKNRCPNWQEMEHVKKLFFEDGETAMQLHVPVEDHLSHHPYTLHIWRPNDGREIPMPPPIMVALPNVA
jgi:hypothetical protein